ncbi:hypothetical protein GCM10010531_23740 [Blastococcus jejuensis]|uniref:AB hydrolase-1 domain-containing protein n=1 Tax=Blastococcus jejuensis TaxID=351224 RepID=A0ABP6P7W7_9ACTN
MAVRTATRAEPRAGTFPGAMEYLTWGDGPRTMLFIQGGPGRTIPTGLMRRATGRLFAPYVSAGYAVWIVARRRHMPAGHSIADMADDYARIIAEQFGGSVDLVVGESFGGMVAQDLAARHPECVGRVALVVSGYEVSPWGKAVDLRLAEALRRGDRLAAGGAFAEYLLPGRALGPVRRLLAPLLARAVVDHGPREDMLVEVEAEVGYDSRGVLDRVRAPVLLICGDRDRFFPPAVVRETAARIPDCQLVWYSRAGHMRAASSSRIARDVLAFAT